MTGFTCIHGCMMLFQGTTSAERRGTSAPKGSLGFISVSVSEPNERTVLVENYKLLPPGLSEKSLFEMQKVSSFHGFDHAAVVISLGSGRVVATFIVHGTA